MCKYYKCKKTGKIYSVAHTSWAPYCSNPVYNTESNFRCVDDYDCLGRYKLDPNYTPLPSTPLPIYERPEINNRNQTYMSFEDILKSSYRK